MDATDGPDELHALTVTAALRTRPQRSAADLSRVVDGEDIQRSLDLWYRLGYTLHSSRVVRCAAPTPVLKWPWRSPRTWISPHLQISGSNAASVELLSSGVPPKETGRRISSRPVCSDSRRLRHAPRCRLPLQIGSECVTWMKFVWCPIATQHPTSLP